MYCTKCGKPVGDNENFCAHCGTPVKREKTETETQNIKETPEKTETKNEELPEVEKIRNLESPKEQHIEDEPKKGASGGCLAVLVVLFLIALVIGLPLYGFLSSNGGCACATKDGDGGYNPQIFSRAATNNDISIDFNYEGVIAINVDVTAKSDIKDLALTLKFTNKNGVTIKTMERYVGNIDEGETERISIGISEFGLNEIFTIHYVEASVTGGSVSYFA